MAFQTIQSVTHSGATVIYERDDTLDGGAGTAGRHRIRVTFNGSNVTPAGGGGIYPLKRPAQWYGTANSVVRRYLAVSYDPDDLITLPTEGVSVVGNSVYIFSMTNIAS